MIVCETSRRDKDNDCVSFQRSTFQHILLITTCVAVGCSCALTGILLQDEGLAALKNSHWVHCENDDWIMLKNGDRAISKSYWMEFENGHWVTVRDRTVLGNEERVFLLKNGDSVVIENEDRVILKNGDWVEFKDGRKAVFENGVWTTKTTKKDRGVRHSFGFRIPSFAENEDDTPNSLFTETVFKLRLKYPSDSIIRGYHSSTTLATTFHFLL